jgi:hypothetical protein
MRSPKRLDGEVQKENGVGNIPTPFRLITAPSLA